MAPSSDAVPPPVGGGRPGELLGRSPPRRAPEGGSSAHDARAVGGGQIAQMEGLVWNGVKEGAGLDAFLGAGAHARVLLFSMKHAVPPLLLEAAEVFRGRVTLGVVPASEEGLMQRYGVRSSLLPRLVMLPPGPPDGPASGSFVHFEGKIDLVEVCSFIARTSSNFTFGAIGGRPGFGEVLQIESRDLSELEGTAQPVVLLFTDKLTVPPIWDSMALIFAGALKLATVRDTNQEIWRMYRVATAPAIVAVDPRTLVATSVFEGEVGYVAMAQWLTSLAASGHGASGGGHPPAPPEVKEIKEDAAALRRRPAPVPAGGAPPPATPPPAATPVGGMEGGKGAAAAAAAEGKKVGAGGGAGDNPPRGLKRDW
ncbi:hypothetical protein T484DRAFT_1901440 [Baffinella frigidus]|nr:hypothetical protein T484DRAFT_1901440 [Cryptophyta sp. CCMP2293]